ncbi:hypothetical protein Mlute_00999 [Meiothermus luteus]|jgi:hypothetical protein|uniref:Uncharacterized protein n=1 Tax=Meiothermus luteus TaxID=2026184 RepID=A0A399EV78_9DEIN|nr:hypothetical protein [Meiothermus luteus]RIH87316.1 hypothetical protein Mlute_00999 [Meiothermus luteus]RMH53617.1 MAG: hypothetical protein D6684_11995 [Deinococcota bacterium]
MRPLAEVLYSLEPGQVLSGQMHLAQGLLRLWVHRREEGFDLYVIHLSEPGASSRPLHNAVGRDLVSATEVLEVLHYLETVYPVRASELFALPVVLQQATPELEHLIQRQALSSQMGTEGAARVIQLPGVRQEWAGEGDDEVASLVVTETDP